MGRFETNHRFLVQHGSLHSDIDSMPYVLYDNELDKVVYAAQAKSAVIAEAQRENGFDPVDGSEATYATQIEECE